MEGRGRGDPQPEERPAGPGARRPQGQSRLPGGKRAPHPATPGQGRSKGGRPPELTEIRAWRITTWGAIGVAGCSLWSPLATCSRWPDTSSPYRSRSLRNTMAAAVRQSRARTQASRDACGDSRGPVGEGGLGAARGLLGFFFFFFQNKSKTHN